MFQEGHEWLLLVGRRFELVLLLNFGFCFSGVGENGETPCCCKSPGAFFSFYLFYCGAFSCRRRRRLCSFLTSGRRLGGLTEVHRATTRDCRGKKCGDSAARLCDSRVTGDSVVNPATLLMSRYLRWSTMFHFPPGCFCFVWFLLNDEFRELFLLRDTESRRCAKIHTWPNNPMENMFVSYKHFSRFLLQVLHSHTRSKHFPAAGSKWLNCLFFLFFSHWIESLLKIKS